MDCNTPLFLAFGLVLLMHFSDFLFLLAYVIILVNNHLVADAPRFNFLSQGVATSDTY